MKIFLIIILIIVVLLVLIVSVLREEVFLIYWHYTDRKNIRNKLIRKFTKGDQVLYLIGSAHGMHYVLPEYSFMHLKAALVNINPDILLVESQQEEIDKGNLADGPPEMLYMHLNAQDLNIPVKGVDYIDYSKRPGTTYKHRDDMITANIIKESNGYNKVLAIVGASHMLIDTKKLIRHGYKRERLSVDEKEFIYSNVESELKYHQDTKFYYEKRIERMKELLNYEISDKWKVRIKRIINEIERAIVRLSDTEQ